LGKRYARIELAQPAHSLEHLLLRWQCRTSFTHEFQGQVTFSTFPGISIYNVPLSPNPSFAYCKNVPAPKIFIAATTREPEKEMKARISTAEIGNSPS
jgi:hypothetical protein